MAVIIPYPTERRPYSFKKNQQCFFETLGISESGCHLAKSWSYSDIDDLIDSYF